MQPADKRPAYQQRVIEEKRELDDRYYKLEAFIQKTIVFASLPQEEQSNMFAQLRAMGQYSEVLGKRIARFGGAA